MNGRFESRLGVRKPSKLREITPKLISKIVSNLSFIDKLKLEIEGTILIDNLHLEGWSQETPVYLFKCKHHGYELGYPSGYYMKLPCLGCFGEQMTHLPYRSRKILKNILLKDNHREEVGDLLTRNSAFEQILEDEH